MAGRRWRRERARDRLLDAAHRPRRGRARHRDHRARCAGGARAADRRAALVGRQPRCGAALRDAGQPRRPNPQGVDGCARHHRRDGGHRACLRRGGAAARSLRRQVHHHRPRHRLRPGRAGARVWSGPAILAQLPRPRRPCARPAGGTDAGRPQPRPAVRVARHRDQRAPHGAWRRGGDRPGVPGTGAAAAGKEHPHACRGRGCEPVAGRTGGAQHRRLRAGGRRAPRGAARAGAARQLSLPPSRARCHERAGPIRRREHDSAGRGTPLDREGCEQRIRARRFGGNGHRHGARCTARGRPRRGGACRASGCNHEGAAPVRRRGRVPLSCHRPHRAAGVPAPGRDAAPAARSSAR